jgi:hypothetical protein
MSSQRYTVTLILLVAVTAASFSGAYYCYNTYQAAELAEGMAIAKKQEEETMLKDVRATLKKAQEEATPAQEFLKAWEAYFGEKNNNPNRVLAKTVTVSESNAVTILERTSGSDKSYGTDNVRVSFVTLKCAGSYPNLFNFLGHLEREFPTARFDSVAFAGTESGTSTRLEVTFYAPQNDSRPNNKNAAGAPVSTPNAIPPAR